MPGLRTAWPSRSWRGAGLVVLIGLTTLATASISPWLTPVYWGLMAWLLYAPARETSGATSAADPAPADADATEPPDGREETGPSPPEADAVTAGTSRAATRTGKRRASGRARPKVTPGAATATWVKVGPNQFVRVETPDAPQEETAVAEPAPAAEADVSSEPEEGTQEVAGVADPDAVEDSWSEEVPEPVPAGELASPDGEEVDLAPEEPASPEPSEEPVEAREWWAFRRPQPEIMCHGWEPHY